MVDYAIMLVNRATVDAKLTALAKRCGRSGMAGFVVWSWGAVTESKAGERIALSLTVEAPKLAGGWSLVARLDHGDGVNVIRAVPGIEAPEAYRTAKPFCDHCKRVRSRNDTFVLVNEAGDYSQVGSSCIADFLGHEGHAEQVAHAGQYLAEIEEALEESYGGGARSEWATAHFVCVVAAMIRRNGWLSGTAAREKGQENGTAKLSWIVMENLLVLSAQTGERLSIDEGNNKATTAALDWAKALPADSVGYLGNLRALASRGYVTERDAGLIGSVLVAHANAMEQAIKRAQEAAGCANSAHVGTVGKRELFELTVTKAIQIESDFGFATIYVMRDAAGNVVRWKTSTGELRTGETYVLKGTVKSHGEYKGTNQTELSRCKVERTVSAAA